MIKCKLKMEIDFIDIYNWIIIDQAKTQYCLWVYKFSLFLCFFNVFFHSFCLLLVSFVSFLNSKLFRIIRLRLWTKGVWNRCIKYSIVVLIDIIYTDVIQHSLIGLYFFFWSNDRFILLSNRNKIKARQFFGMVLFFLSRFIALSRFICHCFFYYILNRNKRGAHHIAFSFYSTITFFISFVWWWLFIKASFPEFSHDL